MKNLDFHVGPIVVCLLVGVTLALVLTRSPKPKPKPGPAVSALRQSDSNFLAYVETGHSNILRFMSETTNSVERAKWLALENQFTNIDWADVAATLRRARTIIHTNQP